MSLTRRQLLQGSGALVVLLPAWTRALAQVPPAVSAGVDLKQVDSWLSIHADNTATLRMGFAELGQGATTALLMVAAEELDLGMDQISAAPLDTAHSPPQGGTYSSASVQRGRPQVAAAAAEARAALLALAAQHLSVPVTQLHVQHGVVSIINAPQSNVTYGQLIGDQQFKLTVSGTAPLKTTDQYRLLGTAVPRADLAARVTGAKRFIQQTRLPGMVHARVVRPAGQAAYGAGAVVQRMDESTIAGLGDAQVVRRGNFVAVVATREWDAIKAARALRVTWAPSAGLPDTEELHAAMRRDATTDNVQLNQGDVDAALAAAPARQSVRFAAHGPYQAHAPFAPNCALADVRPDSALIICASQDIQNARRGIAPLIGLKPEQIRVQFAEGAGTYGHSSYDDVAQAAAVISQLAGKPVRVQFSRADEQGWDTYGPPHIGEVQLCADAQGVITGYQYDGWQHNWSLVDTTTQQLGVAPATEWPVSPVEGVNALVCGGQYAIAHRKLVNHRLDGLQYFKAGWLRSPLDLSFAFVSEQAVDQLAAQLGLDPVALRQRNITDARWRGVLDAATQAAKWQPRVAGSTARSPRGDWRSGRGVGLGTHLISYGAAVADIDVNIKTGQVRIKHLYGAIDAGAVVNPGIVEAQITGQLVQTASRMLLEEVPIESGRSAARDWVSYPILRMQDCPAITPVVVQRMDQRSTGAGEETMAAAAAAIANAFFAATGRRMTRYPFTPERVRAALV